MLGWRTWQYDTGNAMGQLRQALAAQARRDFDSKWNLFANEDIILSWEGNLYVHDKASEQDQLVHSSWAPDQNAWTKTFSNSECSLVDPSNPSTTLWRRRGIFFIALHYIIWSASDLCFLDRSQTLSSKREVAHNFENNSPQYHNESIKDIEPILDVTEWSFRQELQQHLECKEATEEDVTVLQHQGQGHRLEGERSRLLLWNGQSEYPIRLCWSFFNGRCGPLGAIPRFQVKLKGHLRVISWHSNRTDIKVI